LQLINAIVLAEESADSKHDVKYVIFFSYCNSNITAVDFAANLPPLLVGRVFLISTMGQWPGSASSSVVQAMLRFVSADDGAQTVLRQQVAFYCTREYESASSQRLTFGNAAMETEWAELLMFSAL